MDKILVSVFNDETSAFEGLSALKELHREGDITLYASTVISKDASGAVSTREEAPKGPVGTVVGMVAGGLIGLVGGPAGAALGAYVGGFGGLVYDMVNAGITLDFVEDASAALTPGKTAIVAEVDETWVTPVDARLNALGATTYRRVPDEVIDDKLEQEAKAAASEVENLRTEMRQSSAEARANVHAAITQQEEKLDDLVARIDTTLDRQQTQFESKVGTLRTQLNSTRDQKRQQVNARIAELQASHEARQAKLAQARDIAKQSRELAKQSLELTAAAVAI